MQWLSVWLQETNFPYPGPRCQDGRLLRSARLEKSLCSTSGEYGDTNQRTGGNGATGSDASADNENHLPLLNEHGDIFNRQLNIDDFNDECNIPAPVGLHPPPGERPLAGESEYFYDQYVDYAPANETSGATSATSSFPTAAPNNVDSALSHDRKPLTTSAAPVSPNIDLNNTILHTNYFKKRPGLSSISPPQSTSPFTFFGYPIPTLSIGRFFGAGQRGRKDRGENGGGVTAATASTSLSAETTHKQLPPLHTQHSRSSQRGKVRMYQPNSAEFEKYLNQNSTQYHDVTARNHYVESASDETASDEATTSVFKTAFREPASVERGGFRPIVPEHVGGFMPVHDPQTRRGQIQAVRTPITTPHANNNERKLIPVATAAPATTKVLVKPTKPPNLIETFTYYVTEAYTEAPTTPTHRITAPPFYTHTIKPTTSSIAAKATTLITTTSRVPTRAPPPTTTMSTMVDHLDSEFYDDDDSEDMEAQSVSMLKPPPLPVATTTAETILLIPPPEEHVEQFKRHSWVTGITTTTTEGPPPTLQASTSQTLTTSASTQRIPKPAAAPPGSRSSGSNGAGGRSTITKVFTPATLNQYLPTAEEFYRTTPSFGLQDAIHDSSEELLQLTAADAQKREFHILSDDHEKHDRLTPLQARKDGMDWYYESFKKHTSGGNYDDGATNKRIPSGSSLRSGDFPRHSGATRKSNLRKGYLWHLFAVGAILFTLL